MTLPAWLRAVLPGDTAQTWEAIRRLVPDSAYLVGGTAIAVHLRHRVSRDLDFFLSEPADLTAVRRDLADIGRFAATLHNEDTLNGLFNGTKVQFLSAPDQHVLEPLAVVEGVRVAGLGDLLATKLKVIGDRGELRDYYDTKVIETVGGRRAEEGFALFIRRYRPRDPDAAVRHLLLGLGYFEDVADDPFLPETREQILGYWRRRQPEITRSLGRS
ncbi:MAG: nucleotidyl transferase AbiEii/AbiGii toxin family protein [Pseudonocardiaceae bacterium]